MVIFFKRVLPLIMFSLFSHASGAMVANEQIEVDIVRAGKVIKTRYLTNKEVALWRKLKKELVELKLEEIPLAKLEQKVAEYEGMSSTHYHAMINKLLLPEVSASARIFKKRKLMASRDRKAFNVTKKRFKNKIDQVKSLVGQLNASIKIQPQDTYLFKS